MDEPISTVNFILAKFAHTLVPIVRDLSKVSNKHNYKRPRVSVHSERKLTEHHFDASVLRRTRIQR